MQFSYIFALQAATIGAFFYYQRKSPVCTPLLLVYLLFSLTIEIAANIMIFTFRSNNLWVYNIFYYISFPFWIYWMSRHQTESNKVMFATLFLFLLSIIIDLGWVHGFFQLNTVVYSGGTLILLALFSRVIYQGIIEDKIALQTHTLFFLGSTIIFHVVYFFDTLLFETEMLSKPFLWGYSLDELIARGTSFLFFGMLILSMTLGAKSIKSNGEYLKKYP
jgi:hypothetical protein